MNTHHYRFDEVPVASLPNPKPDRTSVAIWVFTFLLWVVILATNETARTWILGD